MGIDRGNLIELESQTRSIADSLKMSFLNFLSKNKTTTFLMGINISCELNN